MTEEQRLVLKIAAGLLDYPGQSVFWERLRSRAALAARLDSPLAHVMESLHDMESMGLERLYVETFDFNPGCALYLTAQEMGDSRDRGRALIELAGLYSLAGYDVPEGQLPDYVPMLLELVAVSSEGVGSQLITRLGEGCVRIASQLTAENPYRALFDVIVRTLGTGDDASVCPGDERPDLEDLPYPVHYPES